MKKNLSRLFNAPWYPLAFGLYPVLALLSTNSGQVEPSAALRPVLVSSLFSALVFLLSRWVFRKAHKSAFFSFFFLHLFFTYGHVYITVEKNFSEAEPARWLWIVWTALLALAIFWVTRPRLTFESVTPALNGMGIALLAMAMIQMEVRPVPKGAHRLGAANAPIQENLVLPGNPPDVYLFLLDSYGRSDLLMSAYGYDNSDFENALIERGFYIAPQSRSNYIRTELSLGSSLNMQYLQELDPTFTPDSKKRKVLWDALKHSAVRYNFESLGYETVNFASGYAWLEIRDADRFMSPPPIASGMTEFEGLFLQTTLARHIQDWGWVDPDYMLGVTVRGRFNYIFNSIDDVAAIREPTFAYIHVISPHPPFVFDPEGNPTYPADFWDEERDYTNESYQRGYLNQLFYLNARMIEAIDTILANSETPPVIIIQGDHGPWMQPREKRLWNFTAIHMPGHEDTLYPNVSPVNLFRLVFNNYFGGEYDILEDRSYYSPVPYLYDFTEIPAPVAQGQ